MNSFIVNTWPIAAGLLVACVVLFFQLYKEKPEEAKDLLLNVTVVLGGLMIFGSFVVFLQSY